MEQISLKLAPDDKVQGDQPQKDTEELPQDMVGDGLGKVGADVAPDNETQNNQNGELKINMAVLPVFKDRQDPYRQKQGRQRCSLGIMLGHFIDIDKGGDHDGGAADTQEAA